MLRLLWLCQALPSAPMGWWQTLPFGTRGFAVGAELVQQPGQVFYWRERKAQAIWAACAEFAALRVPALGCGGCAMACGAREGMDCFVPRDVGELEIGQLS